MDLEIFYEQINQILLSLCVGYFVRLSCISVITLHDSLLFTV